MDGVTGPLRRGVTVGVAVAISVVVFAAVLGAIIVMRQPDEPSGHTYDDQDRAAFMASCAAGGEDTRSTCACAYDKIVQTVPYDRYIELNRQLEADRSSTSTDATPASGTGSSGTDGVGGSSSTGSTGSTRPRVSLPNDIEVLIVGCIARQALTTPAPPTTSTASTASATTPATSVGPSLTIVP